MSKYKYYWNEGMCELRILDPVNMVVQNEWLMIVECKASDWSKWLEGAKEVTRLLWMIRRYFYFKNQAESLRVQTQSALSELEYALREEIL